MGEQKKTHTERTKQPDINGEQSFDNRTSPRWGVRPPRPVLEDIGIQSVEPHLELHHFTHGWPKHVVGHHLNHTHVYICNSYKAAENNKNNNNRNNRTSSNSHHVKLTETRRHPPSPPTPSSQHIPYCGTGPSFLADVLALPAEQAPCSINSTVGVLVNTAKLKVVLKQMSFWLRERTLVTSCALPPCAHHQKHDGRAGKCPSSRCTGSNFHADSECRTDGSDDGWQPNSDETEAESEIVEGKWQ